MTRAGSGGAFRDERLAWRPCSAGEWSAARRGVARGTLRRLLPGVFVAASADPADPRVRVAALLELDPAAVVLGAAAARLTWWPELEVSVVEAVRSDGARPAAGYAWRQRSIPPDLMVHRGGLTLASPALTVLDLVPRLGAAPIDEALRRGATTLPALWEALDLTPRRRGNGLRRTLLHDSRDLPWSHAERRLHRLYRSCGLPFRYVTNHWVTLTDGSRAALDLALPELRLYVEADGYTYHCDRAAFERDRDRDTDLAAQGWQGHRFSAAFLEHRADEARHRLRRIVEVRAAHLCLA